MQLKHDIDSFKKTSASLKPDEAARQWLKLLDRQFGLSPEELQVDYRRPQSHDRLNPMDIWNALPGPAAWDALRAAIETRSPQTGTNTTRDLALQLIVHTLTADRKAQTNDLAQLQARALGGTADDNLMLVEMVSQISQSLLEVSGDPDAIMSSLERRLKEENSGSEFSVPNLVPLVGEQRASDFFRRVFSNSTVEVTVAEGEETKKLARKLALEEVAQLKAPQWQLACSLDGGPLFEALEKKFAKTDVATNQSAPASTLDALMDLRKASRGLQDYSYMQARVYYLLSLISQNRTKDATVQARKIGGANSVYLPEGAFGEMEHTGYSKPLHDFLFELLSQNPDLPFWREYIPLAAQVGATEQMLQLAQKSAARTDLSEQQRRSIQTYLYSALLASDRVDEGIAEIRQVLNSKAPVSREDRYEVESGPTLALTMAKIGRLVGNTNWMEEGLSLTREKLASKAQSPESAESTSGVTELAGFLVDIGRGPEAEALLSDALSTVKSPSTATRIYYGRDPAARAYLSALASVYYRAGRYADVLALLDEGSGWAAKDLADFRDTFFDSIHQHEDSTEDSLRHDVAASMLELGRKDEAKKIANAILDDNGGFDPAYEILVKIGGADLMPRLDELFARDQFEERPLIWKAVVLQQAGKLEEAEAAARHAILIDPSDGEQGPGRRMRAYAVLSGIRKARGDDKEAELFQSAVDAIRLSENADRYYGAGLLKQAISMYEDSLLKFEGAYCIQSRLALRLSEAGKHEEAAEHYRRAYELMPGSFGRVESHCFGCEGAFRGVQAQRIADKVFTSLAKTDPTKPQVHYLLGYLREEQGNFGEALTHFREAVRLDPDYLNAWNHIETVGKEYFLSAADQNAIALNGIRLDPLNRHSGWSGTEKATDLRVLWSAVEAADRLRPKLAESLYPLPASKAEMEKQANNDPERHAMFESMAENKTDSGRLDPAKIILQNEIINQAMALLGVNRYGGTFD